MISISSSAASALCGSGVSIGRRQIFPHVFLQHLGRKAVDRAARRGEALEHIRAGRLAGASSIPSTCPRSRRARLTNPRWSRSVRTLLMPMAHRSTLGEALSHFDVT
jgi:hypothetical protein